VNRACRDRGLPEQIRSEDIQLFEYTLAAVVNELFPEVGADTTIPVEDKHQFHRWNSHQRILHRVCVSEANAETLRRLPPDVLERLTFFEKTTVTKKLRRVAEFSVVDAVEAIRMNGPAYLVISFLNYVFPHLLGETDGNNILCDPEVMTYLRDMQSNLDVPIRFVTTGPLPENQIEIHIPHVN